MTESAFYATDPDDPDAPVVLDAWADLRPGMAVTYTGLHPLPGPLEITELVRLGDGLVVAVLNGGELEVDAANVTPSG